MMKQALIFLLAVVLLAACGSKKKAAPLTDMTTSQLFEHFRKSVVLIKSRSYFKVTFSDNTVAYVPRISPYGGASIVFNEAEAIEAAESSYGTGFFVGDKGIIATNFHVVSPIAELIEEKSIRNSIIEGVQDTRDDVLASLNDDVNAYLTRYHDTGFIRMNVPENVVQLLKFREDDMERDTSFDLKSSIDSLVSTFNTLDAVANKNFTITLESAELSITMDAATNNTATYACHLYNITDESHADLALIQTNEKEIPEGAETSVDLFSKEEDAYTQTLLAWDTVKVATPLYLISYNYGEEIARTSNGQKVQLTEGNVSQESDKYRVLYSIPALPGSSGGPVFNKKGQLIAINYCGFGQAGNFNYGVLSYQLKNLADKKPSLEVRL